jgi:hypothetical protein
LIRLRISYPTSTAIKWGVIIGGIKRICCSVKVVTAVGQLEASNTIKVDNKFGVATMGGVAVTLARSVGVEAASISI